MKSLIALLPLLVVLGGCATPPSPAEIANLDFGSPPQQYEATIKKYFDSTLLDPYTAHYDFDKPRKYWIKDPPLKGGQIHAGYLVLVGVNAKNQHGAFVGRHDFGFIIKDEVIIKTMDEIELENLKKLK